MEKGGAMPRLATVQILKIIPLKSNQNVITQPQKIGQNGQILADVSANFRKSGGCGGG
jgi:hypothetical protein